MTANVGSFPITGVLSAGTGQTSDYNVTLTNGVLTVAPYAFSFKIGDDGHIYGSTANLAADLPATIATGINGQSLAIAYSSAGDSAGASAGSYAIDGVLSSGTGMANDYDVSLQSGTLAVSPAPLTITAGNASSVAGQPVPSFNATYSSFVLGQGPSVLGGTLAFTTLATLASPAGSYAIVPSGLSSSNYAIKYVDGTLVVNAAPPTLTVAPVYVTGVQWQTVKLGRKKSVKELLISFSGALDAGAAANLGAYTLDAAGKKKTSGFTKPVGLGSPSYNASNNTVTLMLGGKAPKKAMQLTINAAVLEDAEGRPLDGNNDGQPGGNYVGTLGGAGVLIRAQPAVEIRKSTVTAAIDAIVADGSISLLPEPGHSRHHHRNVW